MLVLSNMHLVLLLILLPFGLSDQPSEYFSFNSDILLTIYIAISYSQFYYMCNDELHG